MKAWMLLLVCCALTGCHYTKVHVDVHAQAHLPVAPVSVSCKIDLEKERE
jgi:hypothetical protein